MYHENLIYILASLVFGATLGSFINVVIHRLPLMMFKDWAKQCAELRQEPAIKNLPENEISLARPASHCPSCNTKISPWHNIPVFSYLWLKGKCKKCGSSISSRYFLVELICSLLCVFIVLRNEPSFETLFILSYTFLLIPLIFIDIQHKLLPDTITYFILWLGIINALTVGHVALESSVIGVIAGYLSLWSVYILFKLVTGKEGMGHGDFKLLAAIGAWVGWQQLLHVILLSSVFGTLFYMIVLAIRKQKIEMLPFGPFLAIAGWVTLLWGGELTRLYLSFI